MFRDFVQAACVRPRAAESRSHCDDLVLSGVRRVLPRADLWAAADLLIPAGFTVAFLAATCAVVVGKTRSPRTVRKWDVAPECGRSAAQSRCQVGAVRLLVAVGSLGEVEETFNVAQVGHQPERGGERGPITSKMSPLTSPDHLSTGSPDRCSCTRCATDESVLLPRWSKRQADPPRWPRPTSRG